LLKNLSDLGVLCIRNNPVRRTGDPPRGSLVLSVLLPSQQPEGETATHLAARHEVDP